MTSKSGIRTALKFYCQARSLQFAAQYWALNSASKVMGFKTPIRYNDQELLHLIKVGLDRLIEEDLDRIQKGVYPVSVLRPDLSLSSFLKIPKIILDGFKVGLRRTQGKTKDFSPKAQGLFEDLPDYYLRNFHFQTDGYLGDSSANLYDYEVDLLFSGATDAMRRLIIEPLKKHFASNPEGRGLKFLEIGTGTGRSTQFIKMAFPKAKIFGVDLSEPYLRVAKKNLGHYQNLNFLQGDGGLLPFKDDQFDAVYSVFLYHELPLKIRSQVIQESVRVLKSGGAFGYIDSIQKGDCPPFDFFLTEFPKNFHEPFYMNYISNPMNQLLELPSLEITEQGIGLLSKFALARKK